MEIYSYFELDKELGIAFDAETGEKIRAYIRTKVEVNNEPTEEQYKNLHEAFKEYLLQQFECDNSLIRSISREEYLENAVEGDVIDADEFEEEEEYFEEDDED